MEEIVADSEALSDRNHADSILLTVVRPPNRDRWTNNPASDQYLSIRFTFTP
ncbi:MAG: hypothetical protein RIA65_00320 [Woeseia sp.]